MTGIARARRAPAAVALLIVLQFTGCAIVGNGDFGMPLFCTAQRGGPGWVAAAMALLLVGFIPFALLALAWPRVRMAAIILGLLSLAGLALQHALLARGIFYCDGP